MQQLGVYIIKLSFLLETATFHVPEIKFNNNNNKFVRHDFAFRNPC